MPEGRTGSGLKAQDFWIQGMMAGSLKSENMERDNPSQHFLGWIFENFGSNRDLPADGCIFQNLLLIFLGGLEIISRNFNLNAEAFSAESIFLVQMNPFLKSGESNLSGICLMGQEPQKIRVFDVESPEFK